MARVIKPFMSVVVICYNGEKTIGRTLESLLAQKYPKDRFEIIVIDDGSEDDTGHVVLGYPSVRYIRLPENQGRSAARSAGIAAVKGDIYVTFDDDCTVEPKWLNALASGYRRKNVAGVGGFITEPQPLKGLVRKYIHATGNGCPPVIQKATTKLSLVGRIKRYARSCYKLPEPITKRIVPVEELYGANGSYPVEILKSVGGWDPEFPVMEDRDLSRRIHDRFPDKQFYAVRSARMIHDPHLSLGQYLLRPFKRGPFNLKFHQRYGIIPPLFPFPIIALVLATYIGLLEPLHVLTVLLLAPQILYARWPLNFLKTKRPSNLLFPYLQLAEESMVIVGLLRGYKLAFFAKHPQLHRWLRSGMWIQVLLTIAWMVFTLHHRSGVGLAVASTIFLLTMPGYTLLRVLLGYKQRMQTAHLITYSVGLSVIVLMVLGLATNELLQLFGDQHPLMARPLTFAVGGAVLLGTLIAAARKPLDYTRTKLPWQLLRKKRLTITTGLALPFLAAGGAITLNNGGPPWLALLATGLAGAYFLALVWRSDVETARLYPFALYSLCLTILLGTSLRGWHITGHDIMQEYQVFELTLRHAAWHMSYYQDAYNACLSITILPTVLRQLTGVSDPFVYKAIFQLFFTMIAPVLYLLLRNFTGRRMAFLAAFVFLSFPTFLTDITMLNRQETAILCFALALLAGLDKRLGERYRAALAACFLFGMVLSHYSTSYVATGILLITVMLALGARLVALVAGRFVRRVRNVRPRLDIIPLPLIAATLVFLVAWGSLVTQTSGNITRTLGDVVSGLPALFDSQPSNYSRTGTATSSQALVADYLRKAQDLRQLPPSDYYSDGQKATERITAGTDTISPARSIVSAHVAPHTLYNLYDKVKQLYGLMIQGLIGLGLVLIIAVGRWRRRLKDHYRLLVIASLIVIAIQVVLPASLINYGLLRVIQQGLLVLALPIVLACFWLLGLLRIPSLWRYRVLGVGLVSLFFVLSGFLPTLTGGYKPALAFSNTGFYYEAYYTHSTEVAGDTWLAQKAPKGSRVYSDEFSRRQLIAYAGIFAQPTLAPGAIPQDSYVYLSEGVTARQVVPAYSKGSLIYYQLPIGFLSSHKNLVYSSGGVQIYK